MAQLGLGYQGESFQAASGQLCSSLVAGTPLLAPENMDSIVVAAHAALVCCREVQAGVLFRRPAVHTRAVQGAPLAGAIKAGGSSRPDCAAAPAARRDRCMGWAAAGCNLGRYGWWGYPWVREPCLFPKQPLYAGIFLSLQPFHYLCRAFYAMRR